MAELHHKHHAIVLKFPFGRRLVLQWRYSAHWIDLTAHNCGGVKLPRTVWHKLKGRAS